MKAVQNEEFTPLEKPTFNRRKVSYKNRKEIAINKTPQTGKEPYNEKNFEELKARKAELQAKLDNSVLKGLHWSYLPDEIVNFLINGNTTDYKTQVLAKIDEMKEQTNEQKQEYKRLNNRKAAFEEAQEQAKKDNKNSNKNADNEASFQNNLRAGEIATWLARDIIFLKPYQKNVKNQGKPNNDQYNRLQTMLALYPVYKDELPKFFEELGLIGGKFGENHPFLSAAVDFSLYHFYQNYIDAKAAWLVSLHIEIDGKKQKDKKTGEIKTIREGLTPQKIENSYSHIFGKISQLEIKINSKEQGKNYADIPIALPVGLFNAAIMEGMKKKDTTIKEQDNTIFAIKTLVGNDTQVFYDLQRNYESSQETL